MPKNQISPAGRIVEFFKTTPLETADLVLGLCKDEVNTRKQKSRDAKARAAAPAGETATGASAAAAPAKKAKASKKAKGPKKSHHKKKHPAPPASAVEPGLPLDALSDNLGDDGEAGDAPPETLSAPSTVAP